MFEKIAPEIPFFETIHMNTKSWSVGALGQLGRIFSVVAIAPVAFIIPSPTAQANIVKLALLSFGATFFFLFSSHYSFPGGADHFLIYADALAHGKTLNPHFAQRDAGFPLLVWLSGYPYAGSLLPLTLIHAVFSIAMPILIYLAIRTHSSAIAFYAGLFSILSLGPIYFMKWIHHDHLYIFSTVLMLTILIISLSSRSVVPLYGFTATALVASLSRPAGNLLFPIFLTILFFVRREKAVRHYIICLGIFIVALLGYQWHRYVIFEMKDRPDIPSYTGQQVFYNLYINTKEFGVRLSPGIGPNMARIHAALYSALQPSPGQSPLVVGQYRSVGPQAEAFAKAEIDPFSVDEFMSRIFEMPNWEYYALITGAEPNDQILLKASWEIFLHHPLYVMRYALRNMATFLFDPGYAHTRYNMHSFHRIGLSFPPSAGVADSNSIAARAKRELHFDPKSALPTIVTDAFRAIEAKWKGRYNQFVYATSLLMVICWISVGAALIFKLKDFSFLNWTPALSVENYIFPVIATSALLFYNALVVSLFAEPDYRYHHFIELFRIVLSAYGLAALVQMTAGMPKFFVLRDRWGVAWSALSKRAESLRRYDAFDLCGSRHPRLLAAFLIMLPCLLAGWWITFMMTHVG